MKTEHKKTVFEEYCRKRVSFILTTKDRANFLEKALSKAQKLVGKEDELIVIDGKSTDETVKVIKKFQYLLDIFISEEDNGPAHAFNKGILLSKGRYVMQLTDDDQIYPKALNKAIAVLDKNPKVDFLVNGGTKERNGKSSTVYLPPGINYGNSCEDIFNYGACGVGFIVRRKSIAVGGLVPNSLIADANWAAEYIARGLVVRFCRINLYNHPIYDHSIIIARRKELGREQRKLIKIYCSKSFYFRSSIKLLLSSYPINLEKLYQKVPAMRYALWPASSLYRRLTDLLQQQKSKLIRNKKIVWDGGFS